MLISPLLLLFAEHLAGATGAAAAAAVAGRSIRGGERERGLSSYYFCLSKEGPEERKRRREREEQKEKERDGSGKYFAGFGPFCRCV